MTWTRRDLLAATGAAALAGAAGCSDGEADGTPTDGDGTPPGGAETPTGDDTVRSYPVPENPESTYARTGTASQTVTYIGNWKCPFCAAFATGDIDRPVLSLGQIVNDYVVSGDLTLVYRGLAYGGDGEPFLGPDVPRATRFGLAVWRAAPDAYWPYHEHVMANQPPEGERWATLDRLARFARDAGVPEDAVATARERTAAGTDSSAVERTSAFAADVGVKGTPALVIDGGNYSPFSPEGTRQALEDLAG